MASNRHLGRIIALQTLYEQDFRRSSNDPTFDLLAVLKRNIARYEATVDDTAFIEQLVRGIADKEAELDVALQPLAPEWPLKDIARMDRVILRMGAYELTHGKGVPPKVVINEAVELAKAFGSENSSKFINGVLGTLLRQQNGEDISQPRVAASTSDGVADDRADTVATSGSTANDISETADGNDDMPAPPQAASKETP